MEKTMWVYPELRGPNLPERWGHSACFSQDILYVFGGCRGGLHFSDVMQLDTKTMVWSSFTCTGHQPGTRDSHTAVLHDRKMIIFGGTNGSKKINDVHVLDLDTRIWACPPFQGQPPSPRESHSATLIDGNRIAVFGGTGEGEGNYLNDIHILELDTMKWVSPDVKGDLPACRDSHTAVAVKDHLIIYGGDCGDRYLGDLDMFNLRTFVWSKVDLTGSPQPGVRAGHISVAARSKVYVFGGVGDRTYYSDVWMLDIDLKVWTQIKVPGYQPQGRFSHVAVLRDDDIVIYGGCGEDERPLDEFLVLHLGIEQLNPGFPKCRFDGERKRLSPAVEVINDDGLCETERKPVDCLRRPRSRRLPFPYMEPLKSPDNGCDNNNNVKRRRTTNLVGRLEGAESEQDEQSPTMSRRSSPTLSEHDKPAPVVSRPPAIFLQHQLQEETHPRPHNMLRIPALQLQLHLPATAHGQTVSLPVHDSSNMPTMMQQQSPQTHHDHKKMMQQHLNSTSDNNYYQCSTGGRAHVIGSEVRGVVDGAFDSGYLMTAQLNGQVFRGVLFHGPTHSPKESYHYHHRIPPQTSGITTHINGGNYQTKRSTQQLEKENKKQNGCTVNSHLQMGTVMNTVTATTTATAQQPRLEITGSFPGVVAGQAGRWVWQPSHTYNNNGTASHQHQHHHHHHHQQQQQQQQQQQHESIIANNKKNNNNLNGFPHHVQNFTFSSSSAAAAAAAAAVTHPHPHHHHHRTVNIRNGSSSSTSPTGSSASDIQQMPAVTLSLGGPSSIHNNQ